jgi:RING-variant domain
MSENAGNIDAINEDREEDDPAREEGGSMPPSEPYEDYDGDCHRTVVCRRTGLPFQTSTVLQLLPLYDDGVLPSSTFPPFPTEPVFCRICREGLHDDADEEQPQAAVGDDGRDNSNREPSQDNVLLRRSRRDNNESDVDDDFDDLLSSDPLDDDSSAATKGPVHPHPPYTMNAEASQNPMLAPCECSGSMAFVHYLCVEQWRCRSRHPDAANGLNCETCSKPYALPAPSERPAVPEQQEDWLDAMPPHVMQALRQPHIWWQIGAGIVRRRCLRPIAPVLMSPIVALYCHARRRLKKSGVARRRWACSLCRRRARWKCVRCLRSYYCSRQCQNVSWHIIHKHVCYKPIRFWWSCVVYGTLTLLLFPGFIRDPIMYDLGLGMIPVSFITMGVLGGGVAKALKKMAGVDARGRGMELAVVVATVFLIALSWGLIRGFFGGSSACYGALGVYRVSSDDISSTYILQGLRAAVLRPAAKVYQSLDGFVLKNLGSFLRAVVCTSQETATTGADASNAVDSVSNSSLIPSGCFEHLPHASPDFVLLENHGEKCAGDLMLLFAIYAVAGAAFAWGALLKHQERQLRRRQVRRLGRGQQHLHND